MTNTNPARQEIIDAAPKMLRVRCNQNRIFGCGRVNTVLAEYRPIGVSAVAQSAFVWCQCGLPLSRHRMLYPSGTTNA